MIFAFYGIMYGDSLNFMEKYESSGERRKLHRA